MDTPQSRHMTPPEIAKAFEVSIGTVYYWINVKRYFGRVKRRGSRYLVERAKVEKYLELGFGADDGEDEDKSAATA